MSEISLFLKNLTLTYSFTGKYHTPTTCTHVNIGRALKVISVYRWMRYIIVGAVWTVTLNFAMTVYNVFYCVKQRTHNSSKYMHLHDTSHIMRKPVLPYANNKGTDHCASMQSDQCLCYSLLRQYNTSSFYIGNFMPLASFCCWAGRFESYLVANPEDRFSRDKAHGIIVEQVKASYISQLFFVPFFNRGRGISGMNSVQSNIGLQTWFLSEKNKKTWRDTYVKVKWSDLAQLGIQWMAMDVGYIREDTMIYWWPEKWGLL